MMKEEKAVPHSLHLLLLLLLLSFHVSHQLQQSQSQAVYTIQQLLNYPPAMATLSSSPDLCNTDPSPSLTLVCYEDNLTQLHIVGSTNALAPQTFSSQLLFDTLVVGLSNLKVLTLASLALWGPLPASLANLSSLEILNLTSNYFTGSIPPHLSSLLCLQTLILDHNKFTGQLPDWLSSLPALSVLSINNNSLGGSLPNSISAMDTLRILALSTNYLSGEVPDLSNLTNLQVLDLEDNFLGPHFPILHNKLVSLVLRKNRFRFSIPTELSSNYQLQKLDISSNGFVGPFVPSLLSLPSIAYLDVSGNRFTGKLFENMSCSSELMYANLSMNLLSGDLPSCLHKGLSSRVVTYSQNCFSGGSKEQQHPPSFCTNQALAVNISPPPPQHNAAFAKVALALGITGGMLGGAVLVTVLFLATRRDYFSTRTMKKHHTRLITENVSAVNTAKMLTDARYIVQTMKLGALGLPAYRAFPLEELKDATSNFSSSSLMGENDNSQVYRGKLADGSVVAIKSLKMRKRHNPQSYTHHIELISKLRHRHLASALGHSLECYPDDSSVSKMFLIFEFIPNRTLRSCISGYSGSDEGLSGKKLTWTQRISAVIGVTKGIQFLHTGIVPGVFSNNLKITDVFLDHNLHVKISINNLPLLAENGGVVAPAVSSSGARVQARDQRMDKNDVYDIGVILLEIIVGRPIMSPNEVIVSKDLLQVSTTTDETARRSIVDPAVHKDCSDESLKTMMELCVRCLSSEPPQRPSVEDVLWNLQFAAQVQDSGKADTQYNQETSQLPISQMQQSETGMA